MKKRITIFCVPTKESKSQNVQNFFSDTENLMKNCQDMQNFIKMVTHIFPTALEDRHPITA